MPPDEEEPETEYVEWSDWGTDGDGYTTFSMNNPQYVRDGGMAFWKTVGVEEDPMSSLKTEVKKLSGDPTMGYGVIFCIRSDRFLLVKIDTTGYYGVSKIVGNDETGIIAWTYTGKLAQGYGSVNTIQVDYNGTSQIFTLLFNGSEETSFSDPDNPPLTGGKYGFIAGVSSEESFPGAPVDVRFKQLIP